MQCNVDAARLMDAGIFAHIFNDFIIIVRLERNSNALRARDQLRQTFTGFYLTVEQKKNSSSDIAEVCQANRFNFNLPKKKKKEKILIYLN